MRPYIIRRMGHPEDVAGMVTFLASSLRRLDHRPDVPRERRLHVNQ